MSTHPLAGKPARRARLVNVPRLVAAYYTTKPDPRAVEQGVAFGTSGHRGSSLRAPFNEAHSAANKPRRRPYKIYAESFVGPAHLASLQQEARALIAAVFHAAGV